MFTFLGMIGIFSLILSFLHFFKPNFVNVLNAFGSRIVITMEDMIKRHRIKLGFMYLAIAILLIYVGFFLKI